MNSFLRFGLVVLGCLPGFLLTGCSKKPAGYADMLKKSASHASGIGDPEKVSGYAEQWLKDWRGSQSFFTKELDSSDPEHVKTGMLCNTLLAVKMEGSSPTSAADKAEFEKSFPVEKLKKIITDHPEYYAWLYAIKYHPRFGPQLPPPAGWTFPDGSR